MSVRPARLPLARRWFSNLVQAPLFFLVTAGFGTLSLAASYLERDGRMQHRIARWWARASVAASMSRLRIVGEENLCKENVAVYASNHTSYMDTPVLFSALPFQFRILAKQELWKLPFVGWHLRRSGQIPVDTTTSRSSMASLSAGVRALKAGMPLVVFPEGGRTPTGHPQPFMSGAAYLAIRAQVPLVPIALAGVYELLPIHTHHFLPGTLTVAVGDPIATEGYTVRQVNELNSKLEAEIRRLYYQYSSLVPEARQPRENAPAEQPLRG